ncbi:MAG: DUF503 domain-containing protein [Nitrospira sp.]|jgi:uncharacterized protein|uniref:YlxP-like protein n=1 Tax=Candidatus Nitrospira kreftii TaxID=2652173 RepID=A0A7S8J284_9BACT|nr:DUF503 domain-containing protein [Nitrospira sp.]NJN69898.1 DUF503 domain-containing protein [Nitrospira sp.]QPD06120.1 MAG: hypothetical protein Nkreftii_003894 [Candidatus Nitrospira kreftii]
MVVGLCTVELFIAGSQSLKDKRQVLHGLKDRLRGKFNLSIAEVDGQDLWQKAVLGMACVANDGSYVNQVLEQALNVIKSMPTVEVIRTQLELL